jgi:hypothetical protein
MIRSTSPVSRGTAGARLPALVALAVAVPASRLPLRLLQALVGATRWLPAAAPCHAEAFHQTILGCRPRWWPGRIACLEVSLALIVALAFRGRRAHWVLGSRPLPNEAHAWVQLVDGTTYGLRERDDPVRAWVMVAAVPPFTSSPTRVKS